jgi:hypothetical protein
MSLSDDLKALEELHTKGRLTDEEFAAAKSAAITNASRPLPTATATAPAPAISPAVSANKKTSALPRLLLGILLLTLLWAYLQPRLSRPATTVLKEVVHMPVDLRTETFTIPARGWKAIAIEVPYSGSLTINAEVLGRGNAMEMFLTDRSGIEKLQSGGQSTYLGGFYAVKGSSFQHTERMNQGQYFFVVRDRHFGILSASSSDVSLKARIDP